VECRYGRNNGIATAYTLDFGCQDDDSAILVFPLTGNNLILWRQGERRHGLGTIAVRGHNIAMGMSTAVLGLEDVGGPSSEIVDKGQVLLAGLGDCDLLGTGRLMLSNGQRLALLSVPNLACYSACGK